MAPPPRLETLYVPAPALTHTVILRNARVAAPEAGVGAPSIRLAAPDVRLSAPEIRLGAPSLRVPLSIDLAVCFPESPLPALPASSPLPCRSSGAGRMRVDPLPPVAEVLDRLRERLRSELTHRFGGLP